ncbi:AgrB-like protein [Bacillus sp. IT-79MI2]
MLRNIPLLIEYLAFFGLICCFIIYDTNIIFLSMLILFVCCEILRDIYKIRLRKHISHLFTSLIIIICLITNLKVDGLFISSMFPIFFISVLLIVSQYIYVPEHHKKEDKEEKII